jgi:hypothetical protein
MRRIGELLPLDRYVMIHDIGGKEERRGQMMINRGKKERICALFDGNLAMKVGMQ